MAEVSKATLVLSGSTGRLKRALASAQTSMRGVANKMRRRARMLGRAIATAMAGAGAAMAGVAKKAVSMAATFEKEMTKVSTLVGLSRERVQGMRDDVLALAAQTAQAPVKLAKALFRLTSGGERGAQVLRSLRKAAQAARIGMGNVGNLTRVATSSVQAFSKQGETLNSVLNTIFFTIREGNVRVDRLQNSLGQVQSMAAESGVTFDDLGAFLAVVSRSMGDTQKAARGLRSFLGRLQTAPRKMAEEFEKAGFSIDEFRQQLEDRGLPQALIGLVERSRDTDAEIANLVGSVRSLSPILGAAGGQAEEFARIARDMTNAQEEFEGAVSETSRTLADQVGRLKATADSAMIQIGQRMSGAVGDFVDKVRRNMPEIAATVARAMGKVGNAILDTIDFFRSNPLVGEFGLVGLAFFGPAGAAAFAAIGAMIDDLISKLTGPTTELGQQQERIGFVEEQIRNIQRIIDHGPDSFIFEKSHFDSMEEAENKLHSLQRRLGMLRATLADNREEMAGTAGAFSQLERSARSTFNVLEGTTAADFSFGGGGGEGGQDQAPTIGGIQLATPQISGARTPFDQMRQQMQGRQMVPTVGRGGIIDEEEIEAMREELGLGADEFNRAAQTTVAAFGSMAQAAIRGSDQMATSFINGITQIVSSIPGVGGLASSVIGTVGGIVGAFVSSGGKEGGPTPVEVTNDSVPVEEQNPRRPMDAIIQLIDSADPAQMEHDLRRRTRRDATERIPQGTSLAGGS